MCVATMFNLLSKQDKPGRRRSQRVPHFGIAYIRGADGFKAEAIVRDISMHGARMQFRAPRTVPDHVAISIPSLGVEVEASVRWRSLTAFGVQFCSLVFHDQEIDAARPAARALSEPVRF